MPRPPKGRPDTPALFEQGMALVRENNLGAAQLLLQAGQEEGLPDQQSSA